MNLFIIIIPYKQITSLLPNNTWICELAVYLYGSLLIWSINSYKVHGKWYVKEQYSYKQMWVEIIYIIWLLKATLSSSIFCSIEKI
jgi:hypothetical protein